MTDQTSTIKREAENIAAALGLPVSDLAVVVPEWLELMKQGVIAKVHVRRWRAQMNLTPEHLGLDLDESEREALAKSMRLGQVWLLPDRMVKALGSIDSALRKAVQKHSYQTHWGDFLTPSAYWDWKADHEALVARYMAIRDEIANNWDSVLLEVADMHQANARAAYRREAAAARQGRQSQVVEKYSESEFIRFYLGAILDAIPSRQVVIDSFQIEADLYYIPLPSMIAADQAEAEIEASRARVAREKAQAEIDMHREVTRSYRENLNRLVVDHMRGLVTQLNGVLYEAAEDILASSQVHQRLHPRSVVQLKGVIEKIKALNVLDYPDIENMVSQAESLLGLDGVEGRSLAAVQAKLSDISTVTKATILSLGERPTRQGREITESQVPSQQAVRQARQRLGLAVVEPAEPTTRQQRAG